MNKFYLKMFSAIIIIALFFTPFNDSVAQIFKDTKSNTGGGISITNNVRGIFVTNNTGESPYDIQLSNNIYPDFVLSGFLDKYMILVYDLGVLKENEYSIIKDDVLIHNPNNYPDLIQKIEVDRQLLNVYYLISSRNFSETYKHILKSLRENHNLNLFNNPYYFMFLGDSCIKFETTIEKVDLKTLNFALEYYEKSFRLGNKSRKFINDALFPTLLRVVDTLYNRDNEYLKIVEITESIREISRYLNSENKVYVGDLLYKKLYSKIREIEINKLDENREYKNLEEDFELLRKHYSNKYRAFHLQIISLYNFQKRKPNFHSIISDLINEFDDIAKSDMNITPEQEEIINDINFVKEQLKIEG